MSNVQIFKNYLLDNRYNLEELQMEDGSIAFRGTESLEGGGKIIYVIIFNKEQDIVDLRIFDIAQVTNPLKKDAVLELINELNMEYRFSKFYVLDGVINKEFSFRIEDNNLNPELLMGYLVLLFRAAETSYPKFMKLQ